MVDRKIPSKATRKILTSPPSGQRLVALIFAGLFAVAGVYTLLFSHAAVPAMRLYLSPASQTVTTGSDIVVSVKIDTAGASVNTVQSVLSYSATNFSLVSITPGTVFGSFPNPVTSSGSIQFTAGSTTPVSGVQTVATVTLKSIGTGTSTISLASVCPVGTYALTCSAAYDSSNSSNDLSTTTNPITNGSYTVNPVLPTPPTALTSTAATTTSISLSWTGSTDVGGPGVAGYYIYRNGVKVGSSNTNAYTDSTGLTPSTSYTYTVKAYDSATPANVSAASSPLSVPTQALPTIPTALKSTAVTATSVSLSWTGSTDVGGPGVAGYYIYRNGVKVGSSTTTSYTDSTGLTINTSYTYAVKAYDSAGNTSALPDPTVTVKTQPLPNPPTLLKSTGVTTTSISLAWTGNGDPGGPGVAGYYIYRGGVKVGSSTTTSYTDSTGLTPSTSYSYTITAYDTDGDASTASSPLSVSTTGIIGDLDGSGTVTGHDLSILLAHYGSNYALAEFDGTKVVEGHDLSILLSNYGK